MWYWRTFFEFPLLCPSGIYDGFFFAHADLRVGINLKREGLSNPSLARPLQYLPELGPECLDRPECTGPPAEPLHHFKTVLWTIRIHNHQSASAASSAHAGIVAVHDINLPCQIFRPSHEVQTPGHLRAWIVTSQKPTGLGQGRSIQRFGLAVVGRRLVVYIREAGAEPLPMLQHGTHMH
ncbi:hypothetical protein OE88DRAFT_1645542 [Heliocybe sulcata]|uniref:Uncharacterized protein n=1 Tax=Heliocybe sulcata TaxID=5364 RepID=A0A5C3MYB7_9AGAM|nr:hypothetical protein OE88DRAFT_1645542 [Heliocybe sulcata]